MPKGRNKSSVMKNGEIKRAFRATLPVLAGYLVLGIGFGMLLNAKGYGIKWAIPMSVFIYSGTMQYLAVDMLAGGTTLPVAAVTTLVVNARHLFYGISTVDRFKTAGKFKPYMIFALTDETYSIVTRDDIEGDDASVQKYRFFVSLFDHTYWIIGSALGSILGSILKFDASGMDFVLTALFVTTLIDQWMTNKDHLPALTGLIASLFCLIIFGGDNFLIPSMILITVTLIVADKIRKKRGDGND